jgi:hypothetical protein
MCDSCIKTFDDILLAKTILLRELLLKEEKEIFSFMDTIQVWLSKEKDNNYIGHNCIATQNKILNTQFVPTYEQARVWKCISDPKLDLTQNHQQNTENFTYFDELQKWLQNIIILRKKMSLKSIKKPVVKRCSKK